MSSLYLLHSSMRCMNCSALFFAIFLPCNFDDDRILIEVFKRDDRAFVKLFEKSDLFRDGDD